MRLAGSGLATLICVGLVLGIFASHAAAGPPPPGFVVEPVVGGLNTPVAVSFADDGRMFIAEKRGVIRVFRNGSLQPKPFINISDDVNNRLDHGLLGLAVHPDFPTMPYVYALYTHDPPGLAPDAAGARVARVERITADPLNPDVAATGAGARTVILGRNGDASAIPDASPPPPGQRGRLSCRRDGARVEDCIPQDSNRHQIGTVAFGPDGALYVGNGDVDRLPNGPLNPANFIGAIMRIDPLTGLGLPDNPFYDGNPANNLSKTWVHGLRNPFRFSFDPVSGQMFIGDVGQSSWETIRLGQAGRNYGWPCYEGGHHVYGTYQNTSVCQAEYADGPRPPLYDYAHTAAGGSVTGGDWYHGTTYPQAYRGKYFFADYSQGWLKYLTPDGGGGYTASSFASDATTSGIVHIVPGPDSDLYWVSINNATIYRLQYTGAPPPAPPHVLSLRFNDRSGKVASDSSGAGNDARLRKGARFGRGRVRGGLALDGINDIAAVHDSPSFDGFTSKLTVAGWVKRSSTQPGWRNLVSRQRSTTNDDQFYLAFKDGVPYFGVNTSSGGNQKVGTGRARLGKWVHLAGVYSGTTIKLYVNGNERASLAKSGDIVSSNRPVLIGGGANGPRPLATTANLEGKLDEVKLYTQALSPSEIAALANPAERPVVRIKKPAGGTAVRVGKTVAFKGTAHDSEDGGLTSAINWSAALRHNTHTHPDYLPPTTGGSGSFRYNDHGDDISVVLCARVVNSAGLIAQDCVALRPKRTKVTLRSVPSGRDITFGDVTRTAPFTVKANVGGIRTLSAPLSSGCFAFDHWSDGGGATHEITVRKRHPRYKATFENICASAPRAPR